MSEFNNIISERISGLVTTYEPGFWRYRDMAVTLTWRERSWIARAEFGQESCELELFPSDTPNGFRARAWWRDWSGREVTCWAMGSASHALSRAFHDAGMPKWFQWEMCRRLEAGR